MHVCPIHKQHIKYSSILLVFYYSSMIKYRKVSSISFSKMKMNIVIFIAAVNLLPDTCLNLLLLIFPDKVSALLCKLKQLIYIFISGHVEKLMVCIKEFIIFLVRSVDNKRTRKMFRDILECKSKLFAAP